MDAIRRRGIWVGTCAVALALALTATGGAKPKEVRPDVHDVLLRTYPQSWAIGTLYTGQVFAVQGHRSGYAWGFAGGHFNGCAWVRESTLGPTRKNVHAPDCGKKRRLPLRASVHAPSKGYPPGTFRGQTKRRLTAPAKVTCKRAGIWGNYRGGRHLDRQQLLPRDTKVGWRYTTGDGRSALVRWDAGNLWGFIRSGCVGPR